MDVMYIPARFGLTVFFVACLFIPDTTVIHHMHCWWISMPFLSCPGHILIVSFYWSEVMNSWPWYYSGRYSIGERARGVIKSRITAHDTHRAEEPSAGMKKDEKTWITWQIRVLRNGKISKELHGCYSSLVEQDEWISFFFSATQDCLW